MNNPPKLLILGASRGLGAALVADFLNRGWEVLATIIGSSPQLEALVADGANLRFEEVDINQAGEMRAFRQRLEGQQFDALFVNAGVNTCGANTTATADEDAFLSMMLTNAFSAVRALELLEDVVKPDGLIGAMSSELASISGNEGHDALYSSSKAALNMLVKCFAAARPDNRRAILLVAPGWVRTAMGGASAQLSIEESIPLVAELLISQQGQPGLRFMDRNGNVLDW